VAEIFTAPGSDLPVSVLISPTTVPATSVDRAASRPAIGSYDAGVIDHFGDRRARDVDLRGFWRR
jgi:hypothetical protein